MKIEVYLFDAAGVQTAYDVDFDLEEFALHYSIAGTGALFFPSSYGLIRFLGGLFEIMQYWSPGASTGLQVPTPTLMPIDPTEKGFISCRVGKAVADYLARSVNGALWTHCYEDAMALLGHPVLGVRPDFLCDNGTDFFAVESKGYCSTSVSDWEMSYHKVQSLLGPIPVAFSIASVTYNIWKKIACKYCDPAQDGYQYSSKLSDELSRRTFSRLAAFAREIAGRSDALPSDDYAQINLNIYGFDGVSLYIHNSIMNGDFDRYNVYLLKDVIREKRVGGPQYIKMGFGLSIQGIQ